MLLQGMKIVSFCHYLQGPSATQYLADMGADVIKIEPARGPFERSWSGANVFVGGVSGFFLAGNRNKRSFSVDLKNPEGRELVLKLIDQADAVVENFRTGVMEKLGLSYEDLKKRKPDIIFASGTGWGLKGPMVGRTAQDLIIQARSGLIAATGPHDKPTAVGCAIVDQHGGALLAMGVLAAYAKKLTTGQGTHVQGSLLNSGLDLQTEPLTNYMSSRPGSGAFKRQENLISWYHEAPTGVYKLVDAEVVIPTNDIANIAEALDSDALRALQHLDRYDDRDALAAAIAEAVREWTYEDLSRAFDARSVWYGIVQSYEDVAADPQMLANDVFREVDVNGETATLVNHPLRYDGKVPELHTLSTTVGSHTAEILREMGISDAEVDRLFARNIVFGATQALQDVAE
ncbi:CaiB/BaiF CoA transferase family protein [Labrys wisconsinensis]|uniref:Crotonobetainyl-CoA:carnitine CoA-transferase CaiB-like acyl-CoA transferase n=1 Tax=Labrys wisconsinensis TaxID=425677 RepID=A0ABU0JIY5_9HYPH|nr:CaiB/BaiF CoA-transferase family protein [Labrys wisconsinensis]MDQ0474245.1 crotonobetainyl-CoA:carnitine CoA-transferase CaiB-like acyl-CoA transferase [Labrys wisconsinensis]